MKTADQRSFENQNAERESDQRDQSRRRNRETDVAGAEYRPEKNCQRDHRQGNEDRDCPARDAPLKIASHQEAEHRATKHADQQLTGHGRADAELFEMVVTAYAAHQREKWSRLNENR